MNAAAEQQRVALVTGASRGIGRAILEVLGRQGLIVIGTATTDRGAAGIGARPREPGVTGAGIKLKRTASDGTDPTLKAITDQFGAPPLLNKNAGITGGNIMMRMKAEEWSEVI